MKLEKLAQQYFLEVRENEFSRLRAWEFIYAYTRVKNTKVLVNEKNIEKTALHLGLYLAQWGMFRGSSQLIDQNLNYFKWMAKFFFETIPTKFPNFYSHRFEDFADDDFCKEFDEVIKFIRSEKLMLNPSDTLISKILLGIWGEIPALDSFFVKASSHYITSKKINCSSQCFKILLASFNTKSFTEMKFNLDGAWFYYPLAKKIDMALWYYEKNKIS